MSQGMTRRLRHPLDWGFDPDNYDGNAGLFSLFETEEGC
jgi:hypothetical protein